jgi:hypothetical protein
MKKLIDALGVVISIPILFSLIILFAAVVVYFFDATGLYQLL